MDLMQEKNLDPSEANFPSRTSLLLQLLEKEEKFRKKQIFQAIFRSKILHYSEITTLSKTLRESIISHLGDDILTLLPAKKQLSNQATKWLFELKDKNRIEAVRMEFKNEHTSLCISSQVGCKCACSFCTTGRISYQRNLTADEIVDQFLFFVKNEQEVRNVAFMGMGEPFLNPNIFEALHLLTSLEYMNISERRLTLSTVGIPEGIRRLTNEFPQISLTLSLHSPFNEERNQLVPMNRRYPIEELFEALEEHILKTNKKTYLAYLVMPGKNDSIEHVQKICSLIERKNLKPLYHLNLIRYNPPLGEEGASFAVEKKALYSFQKRLEERQIHVTIRQSFGSEIGAACGQLAAEYEKKKSASSLCPL